MNIPIGYLNGNNHNYTIVDKDNNQIVSAIFTSKKTAILFARMVGLILNL